MTDDAASVPPAPMSGPAPAAAGEMLRLSWAHPAGMAGLSLKNFVLRVLTLGVYNFWGKTEVRKRIWSGIRINGEPLQYTGTGKEMFLGFLLVLGVIGLPVLLLSLVVAIVFGPNPFVSAIFQLAISIAFFYLVGVGTHRAVRYRMSRTNWRGIRGGLDGSAWAYGWTYFWTGIVLVATLGWASPWRTTRLQKFIVEGLRFGDRPFNFDAAPAPLYPRFAVLWISTVVLGIIGFVFAWLGTVGFAAVLLPQSGGRLDTMMFLRIALIGYVVLTVVLILYALASSWYRAGVMNHFAAHTTFEQARFSGSATGPSLAWLSVTNTLLVLLTLGILSPVAQARAARYFIEHLRLDGSADLAQILQRANDDGTRGEGLAQAFDIDAF